MFKKTLTAAVAALTLAGATLAPTSQAQAGGLGKFVAAAIVGAVVGSAINNSARAQDDGYRSQGYGFRPAYRPVRGYEEGCGFRVSPIFDEYGNRIGARRVPAC